MRRTLAQIGIPKSTFYAWYERYVAGGITALEDDKPRPRRVWNRIVDDVREQVLELALDEPELSTRQVAIAFTDRKKTFISEASVYRLLKAEGPFTSPTFILMQAADRFDNLTTAINQLRQTCFTYLKVTGWGWFYLSTVLDDFSRYIVTWKLCSTMTDSDVTATLETRLAEQFDAYARTDTPLRYIVRDTGLNREECKYLLRIGRDDIEREQRGELTSRQLAARERAEHWRKVRESVEAARAARAAPPKKRGRPRKVRVL